MRVAKNAVFPFDKHSYCSEKKEVRYLITFFFLDMHIMWSLARGVDVQRQDSGTPIKGWHWAGSEAFWGRLL